MKCERCDTEGHEASKCWYHTQYPYGLSRWQQIELLRSALGAATAALASLGSKPQTLGMCRAAMEKTEQGPPCDGPPPSGRETICMVCKSPDCVLSEDECHQACESFRAEPPTKAERKLSACQCGCPRGKYRDGCACQCHDTTY